MSDNKLSELKAAASALKNMSDRKGKGLRTSTLQANATAAKMRGMLTADAVLELLAERDSNQQNYHNAMEELRIERAQRQAADQRIAELEAKLATPVRLSRRYETAGYCIDEHYCQEAADGDYLDRDELIASLREQGFTVEEDK